MKRELLKSELENWLTGLFGYLVSYSLKSNKIDTSIWRNGDLILDVYYRVDAVRIAMHAGSPQQTIADALIEEGVGYQKTTADPNATPGLYGFFVNRTNYRYALLRLMGINP